MNAAHREWRALKGKKGVKVEEFDQKHIDLLADFVLDQMDVPFCKDIYSFKDTSCTCLADMVHTLTDKEVRDVAHALLMFAKQTKGDQQIRVMDWIAHDNALEKALSGIHRYVKQRRSVLPGTYNDMICKHRLAALIGYGKKKWIACNNLLKENKAPLHGLVGKECNSRYGVAYKRILDMFFVDIVKLATPRATRIVTTVVENNKQTGDPSADNELTTQARIELRDKDEDILELPSSITKRGLYARFLKERCGVIQVLDAQGRVAGVRGDEPTDVVPERYPSWRTFCRHWERYYPKVVVAKAREDICDDCWRYANSFRFKARDMKENAGDTDGPMDDEAAKKEQENNERVIKEAGVHVAQAEIQRNYFNAKVEEAKASRFKQRSDRTITLVLDYAQNMSVPQFGSEQPGQTYYLCPMNVYVFGIVDTADNDRLYANVYTEDLAGKGGNCVASMIMSHLEKQLAPNNTEDTAPFKEINLVMDNCGGQNKNKHVLRLLNIMILRRLALRVNAIFLVKGHTKNPCDRMFNILKKKTRKENIYTPTMLFDALNAQEQVTAFPFTDFYDWNEWENRYMRNSIPGVKSFHVFTVDAAVDEGLSMQRALHHGAAVDKISVITGKNKEDLSWLSTGPNRLQPLGITDIKHVELYDKWRPLVPEIHWKDFSYFKEAPSAAKRLQVRDERASSKKARRGRKRADGPTTQQPKESTQPNST